MHGQIGSRLASTCLRRHPFVTFSLLLSMAFVCGVFLGLRMINTSRYSFRIESELAMSPYFESVFYSVDSRAENACRKFAQSDKITPNGLGVIRPEKLDIKVLSEVLVLTPLSNAENHVSQYFVNLCNLDYPHHLISVVLGEDSSSDSTLSLARLYARRLRKYFKRLDVLPLVTNTSRPKWRHPHELMVQFQRRRHLATSRNILLFSALRDETWVLWMDVDVKEVPRDVLRRLISADKDVIVPACMYRRPISHYPAMYDRNTWRETNESLEFLKSKPENYLMLEGYEVSKRDYLTKLRHLGNVIEIDGVGGCVLLIKSVCHRKGLIFPPYIYKHHIETEGLAKMAKDMGFGVYGMPHLQVFHA